MSPPIPPDAFHVTLPLWLTDRLRERPPGGETPDERMRALVELAALNIEHGTGGPFAAGVYEVASHRLVAVGVNLVASSGLSLAHAEMVALGLAQTHLGTYDLGGPKLPAHELVTTTEPCAMCLGAIPWSGVRQLVCGARHEDACAIGMDEGAKPADWTAALNRRGIRVLRDILRTEAVEVLKAYQRRGGILYNSRQAGSR